MPPVCFDVQDSISSFKILILLAYSFGLSSYLTFSSEEFMVFPMRLTIILYDVRGLQHQFIPMSENSLYSILFHLDNLGEKCLTATVRPVSSPNLWSSHFHNLLQ